MIQERFPVREISAIACVSERTTYKRMKKYDLKIRDFSKVPSDHLRPDELILTNDYSFYEEIMKGVLLKGPGLNVDRLLS